MIESSDPLQLLTRTVLVVKQTSMCLEDREGVVATLSAHNMQLTGEFYQVTRKWSCSVGSSALVSEDSNIIRTGALSDQQDQFLAVEYVSLPPQERPEDTQIDHDIRVRMAPSYVTYDVGTIHRIQNFFATDGGDALDLSALGAQASARIREMQVRPPACTYELFTAVVTADLVDIQQANHRQQLITVLTVAMFVGATALKTCIAALAFVRLKFGA